MLCVLDEELKYPKCSDETFLSKLKKQHASNKRFNDKVKGQQTQFILVHYAGEVCFCICDSVKTLRRVEGVD